MTSAERRADPALRAFAGIPFRVIEPKTAARWVVDIANSSRSDMRLDIHLLNAYSIALTRSDQQFHDVLKHAAINLPDGRPLAWFTRGSRQPLKQVRGPQFFEDVIAAGCASGVKHFLLGGTEDTLDRLRLALLSRHPDALIVGVESPPFRTLSSDELSRQDQRIRDSGAQIVWVGLGTPKQDFEAARIASVLGVPAAAVGAAFDFSAGTKAEAPSWVRRVGMEWSFRLFAEPRRLWRRYLIGNTVFLRVAIPEWIRSLRLPLLAGNDGDEVRAR